MVLKQKNVDNRILQLLFSLDISNDDSIKEFFPKVRDRDDIKVMKCDKSGVIFLSSTHHINSTYYSDMSDLSYWSSRNRQQILMETYEDDSRRAAQFESIIRNKRWLDFGTGAGGILDLLCTQATEICAIEPQLGIRNELNKYGYDILANIQEAYDEHFDIITLFHVFEHLSEPIDTLITIREKMVVGGKLIIEVPHARDFLIDFLNLESFKRFTFWSEHLILHTRQSLEIFLKKVGFKKIIIKGFQRYPLANHLHWLSKDEPGGHHNWSYLQNIDLDKAYSNMLIQLDKTDTLIAIAEK